MEYPVSLQTMQLVSALVLGFALGLHYDLLRQIRRALSGLTIVLDLWFFLTTLLSCLLFALYAGRGQLHWFMLLTIALGATVYFLTLSPLVCRAFAAISCQISRIFAKISQPVKKIAEKIKVFSKKSLFIFQKKRYTF